MGRTFSKIPKFRKEYEDAYNKYYTGTTAKLKRLSDIKGNTRDQRDLLSQDRKINRIPGGPLRIDVIAYEKYLELYKNEDPLDFRSFKHLIEQTNINILRYILENLKSYPIPYIGVLSCCRRDSDVFDVIRHLKLKFNKKVSKYVKTYSFKKANWFSDLVRHIIYLKAEDPLEKDYIFITSSL